MRIVTAPPMDTTSHPHWSPVVVTATLATPVVGADVSPIHLDGPVSWGAYQAYIADHGHHALPPQTDDYAPDFDLPLATWALHGTWGWACSRAHFGADGYTTLAMRRRPATQEMARYSSDRKHHLAAGPMKARDTPLPATIIPTVTWHALADPDTLRALLERVWSLGRLGRHGHGRITRWDVTTTGDRDAWRDRVLPAAGGVPQGVRAPYYHPTRRFPC